MNRLETIESEYRLKRKYYEAEEDNLFHQRDKGIAVLEEVQERSRYYLKDYVSDSDILTQGLNQIEYMKDEVLEFAKIDLQNLIIKIEELDEEYHNEVKKTLAKEKKEDNL